MVYCVILERLRAVADVSGVSVGVAVSVAESEVPVSSMCQVLARAGIRLCFCCRAVLQGSHFDIQR